MLAIASSSDDLYRIVMVLHILVAIVGFGGVLLNGVYAAQAKQRPGPGGLAIIEANFKVTGIAEKFIYAVPVFGVLLVLLSDDIVEFSDLWVGLSIVVYLAAIGLSHAVLIPTVKKIIGLVREMNSGPPPAGGPPPQVAQVEALGKKAGMTAMVLDLALVVVLVLMVFQPH